MLKSKAFFQGFLIVISTFGITMACAQASKSSAAFIQAATIGNQFEISSSRLALQKSQNDDVKQFAQQMVDDHTQASNNLKQAIASSDATISQPALSLDQEHQKMLDKLNRLSGKDFDTQYVKMQVAAHDQAVSLFKDYAKSGDNDALKSFASTTLPTLEEHKKHIHELNNSF